MTATKKDWGKEIDTLIRHYNGDYERFLRDENYPNGIYNKKLMHEIVDLIKKNTVEDKLQALNLLETSTAKFPMGFDANILIVLKKDRARKVRERAITIEREKLHKSLTGLTGLFPTLGSFGALYGENFKKLSLDLSATASAFQQSQQAAKELAKFVDSPIKLIDPKIFQNYQKSIEPIGRFFLPLSTDIASSPIASSLTYIRPIVKQPKSESTIPEALHKTKSEVIKDLKRIEKSDRDIIFNVEAYRLLYNLERFLRDLIYTRICEKHKKIIKNKIDGKDLQKWKDRQAEEQKDPLLDGEYRLIDYSDFSDLKRILEKGRNKEEFFDLLDDEQFRNIISKLDELDSIRKKIAHSRSLTKREFNKLKIYAEDIARLFKK